jgi:hypothetical protein
MSKISGWKLMGESATHDHVAGVLPASGLHFLVCTDDDTRRAVIADLAVAIAAGPMASELVQEGKKADGWRMASGFLGVATGDQCGVAIIGAAKQSDIDAAAAWRAIKSPLPIAVSTAPKSDIVSARLHDLRYEINVGLVIVAADWSRGIDEIKRVLNYRGDFAVLVVSATEPPANVMQGDARVIRVDNGSLELAHPTTVTPWSRSFGLEAITINGERAWGVKPSAEAVMVPEFAPAVQEPAQPREHCSGTVVYAVGSGTFGLSQDEIASWPAGTSFASTPEAVVEAVHEVHGRVRVVVATVAGSKAGVAEEARRARTALEAAHLAGVCTVEVLERKLQDARAA